MLRPADSGTLLTSARCCYRAALPPTRSGRQNPGRQTAPPSPCCAHPSSGWACIPLGSRRWCCSVAPAARHSGSCAPPTAGCAPQPAAGPQSGAEGTGWCWKFRRQQCSQEGRPASAGWGAAAAGQRRQSHHPHTLPCPSTVSPPTSVWGSRPGGQSSSGMCQCCRIHNGWLPPARPVSWNHLGGGGGCNTR